MAFEFRWDESLHSGALRSRPIWCHLRELLFPYRRAVVTVGLLQCDPITQLKSLFLEKPFKWPKCAPVRLGKGQKGMVEPWPPCCWLSLVEPKWPLTQSPLLESTATLDLQEQFSFEDLSSWLPSSPAHSPSPAVPLRVVPTLSTMDMKTAGENWADDWVNDLVHVVWSVLGRLGCRAELPWREVGTSLTCQEDKAALLRIRRFG